MLQINSAGFAEAIKSDSPIFIKIFANWCSPCKLMKEVLENVASKNKGVAFLELDVDKATDVTTELNITGIPTMVMFQSGIETGRLEGYNAELKVQDFIERTIHRTLAT